MAEASGFFFVLFVWRIACKRALTGIFCGFLQEVAHLWAIYFAVQRVETAEKMLYDKQIVFLGPVLRPTAAVIILYSIIITEGRWDMRLNIGVIKGDGIGPEIVTEAMKVLDRTAEVYGHEMNYTQLLMGGASIDVHGVPLTDETIGLARSSDAVLMGSIGGDAKTSPWYRLEPSKRPEAGLLKIRKELNLFANLRPAVLYEELKGACPLKEEITRGGFDMMIMRELTGGLYFGERSTEEVDGVLTARDTLT